MAVGRTLFSEQEISFEFGCNLSLLKTNTITSNLPLTSSLLESGLTPRSSACCIYKRMTQENLKQSSFCLLESVPVAPAAWLSRCVPLHLIGAERQAGPSSLPLFLCLPYFLFQWWEMFWIFFILIRWSSILYLAGWSSVFFGTEGA